MTWLTEKNTHCNKNPAAVSKSGNSVLLCCPFCGGEPELDTLRSYRPLSGGALGSAVAVYCTGDDGCPAEITFCREDMPELSTDQLIGLVTEFWNKRAS